MALIYLVAGEASGDVLGARLMAALRERRPDLDFAGVGGERMEAAGLGGSLFPMRDLSLMGLVDVVPNLRRLAGRMAEAEADILRRRPAALVTIDAPSFALRLAERVRPKGVRVVHYVAPQVWAWRPWRVRKLRERVDLVLALLPFEPSFFERAGVPVRFVGHPVVESGVDGGDGARFRAAHGIGAAERPVVVMPGSRRGEVARLLGVFGEALRIAGRGVPGLRPVLPVAAPVEEAVRAGTAGWPVPPVLLRDAGARRDGYAAAGAGLIKSGTSSLEMAVAGVPHVIGYKVNPVTAAIARRLIEVPHASLVNLLAAREVVPERLQEGCTPGRLAAELVRLLREPDAAAAQRAAFAEVLAMLRPAPGAAPSVAAAEAVLEVVEDRPERQSRRHVP